MPAERSNSTKPLTPIGNPPAQDDNRDGRQERPPYGQQKTCDGAEKTEKNPKNLAFHSAPLYARPALPELPGGSIPFGFEYPLQRPLRSLRLALSFMGTNIYNRCHETNCRQNRPRRWRANSGRREH